MTPIPFASLRGYISYGGRTIRSSSWSLPTTWKSKCIRFNCLHQLSWFEFSETSIVNETCEQTMLWHFHRQLGEKATFQGIKKAGHLVHLERPCVYNRNLKLFLASLHTGERTPKWWSPLPISATFYTLSAIEWSEVFIVSYFQSNCIKP